MNRSAIFGISRKWAKVHIFKALLKPTFEVHVTLGLISNHFIHKKCGTHSGNVLKAFFLLLLHFNFIIGNYIFVLFCFWNVKNTKVPNYYLH